jgi:hypothetical protein
MTEFLVSIDVLTREMSLAALSQALGASPAASSHSVGDPRSSTEVWHETVLRVESSLEASRPLADHLDRVFAAGVVSRLAGDIPLPKDRRILLNIGVFFSTAMCGVEVPAAYLERLVPLKMGLSISVYPHASG